MLPGATHASELTGIDKRSVRRALDGLQGRDLLRPSSRWSEDGARLSDLYTIAPSAPSLREDALPPSATLCAGMRT